MNLTQEPEIVTWPETALRFPRENWAVPEYRSASLAKLASTYFRGFQSTIKSRDT